MFQHLCMKQRKNMSKTKNKLILFVFFLVSIFLIYFYFSNKPTNYEKNYNINSFKISEKYKKENNNYYFKISYKNVIYPYEISTKFQKKRLLINDIKVIEKDEYICILPVSKKISFYPLCSNEKEIFVYSEKTYDKSFYKFESYKKENIKANQIKVNYLNDKNYLIYNYKGYTFINKEKNFNIELFDKDKYEITLVYYKDNKLLTADYSENYYFSKLNLINLDNGEKETIDSDYEISFDSIFIGEYKNNVYLLDKKEQVEYEINLKKKNVNKIPFKVLKDNKFIETTYNKILNNKMYFFKDSISKYIIDNKTLYRLIDNIKVKITDKEISKIIKIDNDTIYYLSNDELYFHNMKYSEVNLMTYSEWQFNNTNAIFISE